MLNAKEALERRESPVKALPAIPEMINQLDELRKKGVLTEEEFQTKKTELLTKI
jgi:predicted Zn-dependent peptidase